MSGRRFLAYFFGAVAKEVGRQQAKLEAKLYAEGYAHKNQPAAISF